MGLLFGLVQSILTEDLGMKHISVKSVPQLLTIYQKEIHLAVDRDLLQCDDQGTNFMKAVTNSDESSVYGYNPETKPQPLQWKTVFSEDKKARQVQNKETVMLTVFFNHKGIVYH